MKIFVINAVCRIIIHVYIIFYALEYFGDGNPGSQKAISQ